MRETAIRMWTQIREYLDKMPRNRKIQLAVLTAAVLALAITVVSLLSRTTWVLLPGTGDPENTSHIYTALEDMGVPTRVVGNSIEVPEDRLGDVQMRLREQGLLGTMDFSRDLWNDASGFGVTDAHARRLYDGQLGADIRTTLLQNPRIQNALVIVSSGETSPFRIQTNARQATASVMLTLRNNERLSRDEVQGIGELVRTAVPGIEYENISIIDSEYNYYPVGDRAEDLDEQIGQRMALQKRLQEQLQMQVEQLLSPIYGMNNLQVQPNVILNFDIMVTERVEFEPPIPGEMEGIIRSSEEIYELSRRWQDAEGIPGTDSNLMGTLEYPWGNLDDRDDYRRAMISKNMEINELRQHIEHEQGTIRTLSIAVLLNSEAEGVTEDYSEQVADLVAKAIGVAPNNISVQLIPFTYIDTSLEEMFTRMEELEAQRRRDQIFETILMYTVIALLIVMVFLLGRTIIKALKPPPEPEPILLAAGPEGIDFFVGDDDDLKDINMIEGQELEEIDLNQKSPGLEQIEKFIDKDAESVAQLLRNWLSDEG